MFLVKNINKNKWRVQKKEIFYKIIILLNITI